MAITVVQSINMSTYANNPSLAFSSNNTAGNVLALTVWSNYSGTTTVTDTRGNAWTSAGTAQSSNAGATFNFGFTCLSCASGANTVTVNNSSNLGIITLLMEIHGITTPGTENWTTKLGSGASDSIGPITPSNANSIIISHSQAGSVAAGSAISAPFSNAGATGYGAAGWDILTSIMSTSASYTGMSGSNVNGYIIFDITTVSAIPHGAGTVVLFMG